MKKVIIFILALVFIVNISCNSKYVSKGVLESFSEMNQKLEESIASKDNKLDSLIIQNPEISKKYAKKIKVLDSISIQFNTYLENLKENLVKSMDKNDFSSADKSSYLDSLFFSGKSLSEKGNQFLKQIDDYKNGLSQNFIENQPQIVKSVSENFKTEPIDGVNWVEYNFKGFPLITSITKFSQMQSDIKATKIKILTEIYSKK